MTMAQTTVEATPTRADMALIATGDENENPTVKPWICFLK